ncbi:hypothetical protein Efla_002560 [Eimeria flavescens]
MPLRSQRSTASRQPTQLRSACNSSSNSSGSSSSALGGGVRGLLQKRALGQIGLLEIDLAGVASVRRFAFSHARFVFIEPPSFAELKSRLKGRNTETADSLVIFTFSCLCRRGVSAGGASAFARMRRAARSKAAALGLGACERRRGGRMVSPQRQRGSLVLSPHGDRRHIQQTKRRQLLTQQQQQLLLLLLALQEGQVESRGAAVAAGAAAGRAAAADSRAGRIEEAERGEAVAAGSRASSRQQTDIVHLCMPEETADRQQTERLRGTEGDTEEETKEQTQRERETEEETDKQAERQTDEETGRGHADMQQRQEQALTTAHRGADTHTARPWKASLDRGDVPALTIPAAAAAAGGPRGIDAMHARMRACSPVHAHQRAEETGGIRKSPRTTVYIQLRRRPGAQVSQQQEETTGTDRSHLERGREGTACQATVCLRLNTPALACMHALAADSCRPVPASKPALRLRRVLAAEAASHPLSPLASRKPLLVSPSYTAQQQLQQQLPQQQLPQQQLPHQQLPQQQQQKLQQAPAHAAPALTAAAAGAPSCSLLLARGRRYHRRYLLLLLLLLMPLACAATLG